MPEVEYAEFAPRGDIAPIVHCVWTFAGDDGMEDQPIMPDGRCELIVHCGEPYLEYKRASKTAFRQPPILFAGQVTRPLTLRASGPVDVVAVRFQPAGARAFLGTGVGAFTDRCVDLVDILGDEAAALLTRVRAAPRETRLDLVQDFVAKRFDPAVRDGFVERCVAMIYAGEPIEAARRAAKVSVRMLQRRFVAAVGVSPRTLAAIVRFRRVFEALQQADAKTWTQAAHGAGYYDLPQLVRDFRRFAGLPPSAFQSAGPGLAKSLVQL